jgi:hypothetical protein
MQQEANNNNDFGSGNIVYRRLVLNMTNYPTAASLEGFNYLTLFTYIAQFLDDRYLAMSDLRPRYLHSILDNLQTNDIEERRAFMNQDPDNIITSRILQNVHRYWRDVCIPHMTVVFNPVRLQLFFNTYRAMYPDPRQLPDLRAMRGPATLCHQHIMDRGRRLLEMRPYVHLRNLTYGENLSLYRMLRSDALDWVTFFRHRNYHLYLGRDSPFLLSNFEQALLDLTALVIQIEEECEHTTRSLLSDRNIIPDELVENITRQTLGRPP